MGSQYFTDPNLYPMTSHNDRKRPYQYQEVGEEDRLSRASASDKVRAFSYGILFVCTSVLCFLLGWFAEWITRKESRAKRKIRLLRVIERALNLLISAAVLGIMLNTYLTFRNNRTITSGKDVIPIYPDHPIVWPTYMMISTGAVSVLFNAAIVIAYYCGVGAANKVNTYTGYGGYLLHAINFGVWIASTAVFRMQQGAPDAVPPPNDIWGWTCSNAIDKLTSEFTLPVNFDLQCTTQNISFIMGIVNAGLEILGVVIDILAIKRLLRKKRLALIKERVDSGMPAVR